MSHATRLPNADWITTHDGQRAISTEHALLDVLMDIRKSLNEIKAALQCQNALRIPFILDRIEANTKKKRPKKRRAKQ